MSEVNTGASVCANCNAFKEKKGSCLGTIVGFVICILFVPMMIMSAVSNQALFIKNIVAILALVAGVWLYIKFLKNSNGIHWKRWN
jgi:ABC-type antimicrobial peptide transport system permease subunit